LHHWSETIIVSHIVASVRPGQYVEQRKYDPLVKTWSRKRHNAEWFLLNTSLIEELIGHCKRFLPDLSRKSSKQIFHRFLDI